MEPKAKYIGIGEFYQGIPARDLSEDEYNALSEEQKTLVGSGRIYEVQFEAPPIPIISRRTRAAKEGD